jgi:3-methyl-2-oxobutanoate hydroxymethyltransferase
MSASPPNSFGLFHLHVLQQKKERGERIAMISLYDAPTAALSCEAGADVLLVGDSLGNVILGYDNTIPVTIEDMQRHTAAVMRGVKGSSRPQVPVVADLSFGSYHGDWNRIIENAVSLMQLGAHAVKLEGAGQSTLAAMETIVEMGAPVVGHLGFTPQSVLKFGRVVQGRGNAAVEILDQAKAVEEAGAAMLVIEAVPIELAQEITSSLSIPVIGIGAGIGCDGQVLVWHDLVGFSSGRSPRFVKRYAQLHGTMLQATRQYVEEVQGGVFPGGEHSWTMSEEERAEWERELQEHQQNPIE